MWACSSWRLQDSLMQSTKSPLTFKALNGLGSGCHGDMISAIWRTVFELRQGLESMAPERSQQGIINEMFSAVMPPCWPTDRAFFAATWKDSGSCRFCLDRVSHHFYFCSSLNSDWSFSRMHYLYMGTPIQIRWREVWMFSEAADGDFQTITNTGDSASTEAAVRCGHQSVFILLGRSLACNP